MSISAEKDFGVSSSGTGGDGVFRDGSMGEVGTGGPDTGISPMGFVGTMEVLSARGAVFTTER